MVRWFLLIFLAGCSNVDRDLMDASLHLTGRVVKGPVTGAEVSFEDMATGHLLGAVSTDDDGAFEIDISGAASELLVCASGGQYIEEATATLVKLGGRHLCRVVAGLAPDAPAQPIVLTPWSHLASQRALYLRDRGAPLEQAVREVDGEVDAFLGCRLFAGSLINAVPLDPTRDQPQVRDFSAEVLSGLMLGALSYQARLISESLGYTPGVRVTSWSLTQAYGSDLSADGILNGVGPSGTISVEGFVLDGDSLRTASEGLPIALKRFMGSDRNLTGIAEEDVDDFVDCMMANSGPLFGERGADPFDDSPPIIVTSLPESDSFVSGVLTVSASADDKNGVASLVVRLEGANTEVLIDRDESPERVEVMVDTRELDDLGYDLVFEASDSQGNVRTERRKIFVDNGVPVLTPLDAVYCPKNELAVTYSSDGNHLSYDCNTSGFVNLAHTGWFELAELKVYFPQLAEGTGTHGPRLKFIVGDPVGSTPQSTATPAEELQVHFSYWIDGTEVVPVTNLVAENAQYEIPISYETLAPELGTAPKEALHEIRISVTDRAGNALEAAYRFVLHVYSPPLYMSHCAIHDEILQYTYPSLSTLYDGLQGQIGAARARLRYGADGGPLGPNASIDVTIRAASLTTRIGELRYRYVLGHRVATPGYACATVGSDAFRFRQGSGWGPCQAGFPEEEIYCSGSSCGSRAHATNHSTVVEVYYPDGTPLFSSGGIYSVPAGDAFDVVESVVNPVLTVNEATFAWPKIDGFYPVYRYAGIDRSDAVETATVLDVPYVSVDDEIGYIGSVSITADDWSLSAEHPLINHPNVPLVMSTGCQSAKVHSFSFAYEVFE